MFGPEGPVGGVVEANVDFGGEVAFGDANVDDFASAVVARLVGGFSVVGFFNC